MVQQTVDSKFGQYGLANSETGFPHHDKHQAVHLAAKKTALRELQNDNRLVVPKSMGSSPFLKEVGPTIETNKVAGSKRPAFECLSLPHQQSQTSNVASGHLVYVRRKSESEIGKSSICDNTNNGADYQQSRELGDLDETTLQKSQIKETKTSVAEVAHIPRVSLLCLPPGRPSVPSSLGKSGKTLPPVDSSYLSVTSAIPSLDYPKRITNQHWEDRYLQLQILLKNMGESNQDDYIQMLRSLSSGELSRHAVELEKRSIQLSLEEAKEMQRVRVLDVMGKHSKNARAPSTQQGQSDK